MLKNTGKSLCGGGQKETYCIAKESVNSNVKHTRYVKINNSIDKTLNNIINVETVNTNLIENKQYKCPYCDYVSERKNNSERHIKTKHNIDYKYTKTIKKYRKSKYGDHRDITIQRLKIKTKYITMYCCNLCKKKDCFPVQFDDPSHILRHLDTIHYNPTVNQISKKDELKKLINMNKMWITNLEKRLKNIDKVEYDFEYFRFYDKYKSEEKINRYNYFIKKYTTKLKNLSN
jgi:hypothetical protein